MATVNIELGGAMARGAPVAHALPRASQTITSSASNQVSTIVAKDGEFVTIATSADIYVASGPEPDATATPRRMATAGRNDFGPLKEGDKIALVDV